MISIVLSANVALYIAAQIHQVLMRSRDPTRSQGTKDALNISKQKNLTLFRLALKFNVKGPSYYVPKNLNSQI